MRTADGVKSRVSAKALVEAASRLSTPELDKVADEVGKLRASRKTKRLSGLEADLVRTIRQRLPKRLRQRHQELQDKLEYDTLTPRERSELFELTNEIEWRNVRRLQCLIQLAALRCEPSG